MKPLNYEDFEYLLQIRVSPTYDKAVRELADILYGDYPLNFKKKHLHDFAGKFSTNKRFWYAWQRIQTTEMKKNGNLKPEDQIRLEKEFAQNSTKHIPSYMCSKHIYSRNNENNKLRCQVFGWLILKDLVENIFLYEPSIERTLPHSSYYEKSRFLWYQVNITKFSSYKNLDKIEKCVQVYAEFNKKKPILKITKWIKALAKKTSPECMVKTIESLFDGSNRKGYKHYFHFAKKYSEEKLLDVYRRYCRTFVDDLKMRKKYRKKIKSAGKKGIFDNTKWILDSIKLEYDFGSMEKANKLIKEYVEKTLNNGIILTDDFEDNFKKLIEIAVAKTQTSNLEKPPRSAENYFLETPFICCKPLENIKFNKKNMVSQEFSSFPKTIFNYIRINASYGILQKLQNLSKQMYLWTNLNLYMKISITNLEKTEAQEEALFISCNDYSKIDNIQNIFIFNTLFVNYEKENNILSKFIPKISKCDVKYLIICSQILTMEEYNFLTNSKSVKGITLIDTVVKNICGNRVSLESLLKNLPNLENLKINPSPLISYETFETINNYERNGKIKYFSIEQIIEKFDSNQFCNFLKNHFQPNFYVYMLHNQLNDCEYLKPAIQKMLDLSELKVANRQSFYIKLHENLAFGTRNPLYDW